VSRPKKYNTAQSKAILDYMASLGGAHVTAAQVAEYFGKSKLPIGLTTVYRHLDELTERGKVRKYYLGGVTGACYQYITDGGQREYFHLKCDGCGGLTHLRCDMLDGIPEHLYEEHSFLIDKNRVVFYGKCADCLNKTGRG
jgi:Fur family ferric uptake transcriptional regulator